MNVSALCSIGSDSALAGHWPSGEITKTTDYGHSWARVHIGDSTKYTGIWSIAKSPTTGTIIATTYDSQVWILRSTDNGGTWTEVQQLTNETVGYAVVCLDSGRFLASTGPTDSDIWKSDDDGLTWTFVVDLGVGRASALVDCGSGVVMAGTGTTEMIYRSTDYGDSWGGGVDANTGGTIIFALLKIPNTNIVLAGGGTPAVVSRSTNNGVSFSTGQQLAASGYVFGFAMLGTTVLACVRDTAEIWKSEDNGVTWTLLSRKPGSEVGAGAVSTLANNIVLFGGRDVGVPLVSIDSGKTFSFGKLYSELKDVAFPDGGLYDDPGGLVDIPLHDGKIYSRLNFNTPHASLATAITFAGSDLSFPALEGVFQQPFRPAYFNGTTSIINLGNRIGAISEDTSRPYFVCSFWFRPDAIPVADQVILSIPTGTTFKGTEIIYKSDGGTGARIRIQLRSHQETFVFAEYDFPVSPAETWKHLAFSWFYNTTNNGYVYIFVDGVRVAQTTGADFTYGYFNYTATPTHKEGIGARHDGTTASAFYAGHLALLTMDHSANPKLTTDLPPARYAAICGGFKDVHTRNQNSTMFSANNLRI